VSGEVLAIITARGGSKGLPRKNVLPLAGKPLIGWSIAGALASDAVGRVVVSTDDPEIAEVARAEGAEVPFLRPAELATDTASSLDVLRHALTECPGLDHFVLLQPTSPLRQAKDIDAVWQKLQATGAASCVSVCETSESPWLMYLQAEDGRLSRLLPEPAKGLRRQDLPATYRLNGAIYLARREWFLAHGRLIDAGTVAYVMPPERSIDIDTRADFDAAEGLLRG
jgi:CMP-N-acetylneuraminic acid synthetase